MPTKIFTLIFFLIAVTIPGQSRAKAVTDQLSRKIIVPDNPRRVVALAPSIAEIIFALKQENRLKGVTMYSNFPEAATRLPQVGSYVHLDLERIVALKPDLCIAIKDGNPKTVATRLESFKIPVYGVDPKNLETIMNTVTEIGNLLNAENRAEILVKKMRSRINSVKSLVGKTIHRPGVFFQIGISPIVSAGSDTFTNELIVTAGGKNLAQGPVPYPRYSMEQVLALSPEVIIITSMARAAIFKKVKEQWSKWPNLPAVREQRIFLADSDLFDRPTPRLIDGLELLVKLIHPELFNTENKQ